MGPEDDRHAAAADLLIQPVVGDLGADIEFGHGQLDPPVTASASPKCERGQVGCYDRADSP